MTSLLSLTSMYGCPAPTTSEPSASASYSPYYPVPYPSSTPSAAASNAPNDLASLKAGILPDTSLSETEKRLAGMLVRKTVPIFPMKVGVLLYQDVSNLGERDRRVLFEGFLNKLKENPNIGQVIEISSNLISRGADIEEIRKLAARFQVSSVIVLSESYQYPYENKEALVTPSDLVTGTRTWESYSKIESYGLDILNGVFIFSTAYGARESDKYSRSSKTIRNPDTALMRTAAEKAWSELQLKVSDEVNLYKKRLDENKLLPIDLNSSNSSTIK
jgi:hypothetical protein